LDTIHEEARDIPVVTECDRWREEGAYGAIRVVVNCNQTGEDAGTAAYLALDAGVPVGKVDTEKLRETLRKDGSIIFEDGCR